MKKLVLTLGCAMALATAAEAQNLRAFIGTRELSEVATDNKAMPDGGAVIVGYSTRLDGNGNYDYRNTDLLIARVNASGALMWSHVIGVGNNLEDKFRAVTVTPSGNVVAVGSVGHTPYITGVAGNPGFAAAYCFDGNTGTQIWHNHIRSNNNLQDQRGEQYNDVAVKADGNIVAVGGRDIRPGACDGLVTLFNGASGSVIQSQAVAQSPSSDMLGYVTTDGNRVYANGYAIASTYYDLTVMELDPTTLLPVWSNKYDYTFNLTTADGNTVPLTNQWPGRIACFNGRLIMMAYTGPHYSAGVGGVTGFLSASALDGSSPVLTRANHDAFPHQNNPTVYFQSLNRAYTAANPGTAVISYLEPAFNNSIALVNNAILTELNPSVATPATVARQLLRPNSIQGITAVHGAGGVFHYSGISAKDAKQQGADDIYYVRSVSGVPDAISEECQIKDADIQRDAVQVVPDALTMATDATVAERRDLLTEGRPLSSVVICGNDIKPCGIDAISYSGSTTNPYNFTFSATAYPSGAMIEWSVDGTPVGTGSPFNHTFSSPGYYVVCATVYGEDKKPCAQRCFNICVADNGREPDIKLKRAVSALPTSITAPQELGNPYPNPTTGQLSVPVNAPGGVTELSILSVDGKVLLTETYNLQKGSQLLQLTAGSLPAGTYMLQMSSSSGRHVKPFAKQ